MSLRQTEILPDRPTLDMLGADDAVRAMLDGQIAAANAVHHAAPAIAQAAHLMADCITSGGTLVFAAAGSSGLMALADVCELPGTFGIPAQQLRLHMAGGVPVNGQMPGQTEDDTHEADAIVARITDKDCLIVLSASGTTPYPVAIANRAAAKAVPVIGIANNAGTPLLTLADVAVCLPTPPEVLAGSTRLGAGTAQKIALNAMSTLMGALLGHIFRGRMVNLTADNAKLRDRAARIVRDVTGADAEKADAALETANGRVKLAILVASGMTLSDATAALSEHKGHLGPCLN